MDKTLYIICGRMGAGKDTVAKIIQDEIPGTSTVSLAGPLKKAASELFEIPMEDLLSREGKKKPVPLACGKSVRQVLQILGTEVCRNINVDFWVEKAKSTIDKLFKDHDNVCITDARFLNEVHSFTGDGMYYDVYVIILRRAMDDSGNLKHASEQGFYDILEEYAFETIEKGGDWNGQFGSVQVSCVDNRAKTLEGLKDAIVEHVIRRGAVQ